MTFAPSGDASYSEGWPGASGRDWVGWEGRALKGAAPGVPCSSDAVFASRSRFPRRPARLRAGHPCDFRTADVNPPPPSTPRFPSAQQPGEDAGLCVVTARFRGEPRTCPRGTTGRAAVVPGLEQTAFQAPSGRVVRGVVSILRRHPGI